MTIKNVSLLNKLFFFFKLTCLLGFAVPMGNIVLKLSAHDFMGWKRTKNQIPLLQNYLTHFPVFDLESYPLLSSIAWHHPYGFHTVEYYIRFALFSLLLLLVIVNQKNRVIVALEKLVNWYNQLGERKIRRIALIFILGFPFCFITKTLPGFFYPGIAGWTYQKKELMVQTVLPDSVLTNKPIPSFIESSINSKFLSYPESGYYRGRGEFLHFKNGKVLPFNFELLGFVFPRYVFGKNVIEEKDHHQLFLSVIKNRLEDRKAGRSFLLPWNLAYPDHTIYQPISYEGYPASVTLLKASVWDIWVKLENNQIEIISAELLGEIKDKNV